ncbi:hypothetical protein [Streptomyces sp. NPDC058657]
MAFRKSIPQSELRDNMSAKDLERHGTDYQASRGGHLKKDDSKSSKGGKK